MWNEIFRLRDKKEASITYYIGLAQIKIYPTLMWKELYGLYFGTVQDKLISTDEVTNLKKAYQMK